MLGPELPISKIPEETGGPRLEWVTQEEDSGPGNAEVAEVEAYTKTLTCSTVRGELISSPRRIMDLCVSTSESWKGSKPRRSLATFSTERKTHVFLLHGSPSLIGIFLQLGEEIPGTSTRQVTKPQHKSHSPLLDSLGHTQSFKFTYPVWGSYTLYRAQSDTYVGQHSRWQQKEQNHV